MKPKLAHRIPGFRNLPHDWQRAILALEHAGMGTLTPNGFLTDKEVQAQRWLLSKALRFSDSDFDFHGEVTWSIQYLRSRTRRTPHKRPGTIYSYNLKHCLECERETEKEQGAPHSQTYICNGAAILAAKLCGLKIKRPTLRKIDPNAQIAIGEIDPIKVSNWGGYGVLQKRGSP